MAKPTPVHGLEAATPMAHAARALRGARLADLQRHLSKLGTALDSDDVHDARVASRRLRAALMLLGDGKRGRRGDRVVRDLQDALGDVRDLQVQIQAFAKMSDGQASPLERTALRHVREFLSGRLPAKVEALQAAIPRWQLRGVEVLRELDRQAPKGKLGGHRLRERLVEELEELELQVIKAEEDPSPVPMHELRKAVKRYRYALELLEPAMPSEVGEILGSLVPLQESLGTLHDSDVRVELVDTHADGGTEGRDGVLRRLRADRDRQAQEVLRALGAWEEEAVALRTQVLLTASPLKRGAGRRAAGRG
jgi:CHAD domain-containing protein